MSAELQEIYKMHKIMTDEDMEHDLLYSECEILKFFTMRNIDNTYFKFGLDRVKNIFDSLLLKTTNSLENEKYNYNLPVISNQKTNAYLKEIGDCAGIKKNLHFHLARHTALTMMLSNGVPIEIVAKIAGHTNIRQTQHYAKVAEQRVLAYASNLN